MTKSSLIRNALRVGRFGVYSVFDKAVVALAVFAGVVSVGQLAANEDDVPGAIIGLWDTGDGAHVQMYQSGGKYFGKFVSFYDEPPAGGLDTNNPDPTLRGRTLLGSDFILNFVFVDNKWKSGRIYNPENGKQYKADLELKNGVLKVRGWILFRLLGRTVEWTRIG